MEPISIIPKDVTGKLYMREVWASGDFNGAEYEVTRTIDGNGILVDYNDKLYMVTLKDLVEKILERMEA